MYSLNGNHLLLVGVLPVGPSYFLVLAGVAVRVLVARSIAVCLEESEGGQRVDAPLPILVED